MNRTRPKQIVIRVSEEELAQIFICTGWWIVTSKGDCYPVWKGVVKE